MTSEAFVVGRDASVSLSRIDGMSGTRSMMANNARGPNGSHYFRVREDSDDMLPATSMLYIRKLAKSPAVMSLFRTMLPPYPSMPNIAAFAAVCTTPSNHAWVFPARTASLYVSSIFPRTARIRNVLR